MRRWLSRLRPLALLGAAVAFVVVTSMHAKPSRATALVRTPSVGGSTRPGPTRQVATRQVATRQLPTRPVGRAPAQVAPASAVPGATTELSNFWGADISWPQCHTSPSIQLPLGFLIIGLNDGRPFTTNPCLSSQLSAASDRSGYAVYANIDAATSGDPTAYGQAIAADIQRRLQAAGLHPRIVWLDVEVINHWSTPAVNVAVIRGAVTGLAAHGITAGIYSSPAMWAQITGGASLSLPVWTAASVVNYRQLTPYCELGLGGHPAVLSQYVAAYQGHLLDIDVLCAGGLPQSITLFSPGNQLR
ncbi:MAG: glycoside hydrolase family 25 domain-containing protein [Mycobacteriales bacterium]